MKDKNGREEARINGIAAKRGGMARYWIACSEVIEAIECLISLQEAGRENLEIKALMLIQRHSLLLKPGTRVSRRSGESMTKALVFFAKSRFRATAHLIGRLHAHVARKTFAAFVVRRDKRSLEALAYHYGHLCKEITDNHYVGVDFELAKMLSEENREDLSRVLMDLVSTEAIGGKAGVKLAEGFRKLPEFQGKVGLQRLVDKLIDDGVQVAPCDWGYCVYFQALSACGGDTKGPNEVNRSPDVCGGCANFSATEKHRMWWEARVERDDEFLKKPRLAEQTIQVVKRRRAKSEQVLRGIVERSSPGRSNLDGAEV